MNINDLSHEDYVLLRTNEIIATAESILKGNIGIILGSRMIGSIRPDLVEDSDPDFSVFVGVDSQTDHLPVDGERNNWGEEALKRKDIEIAEAEAFHKDSVMIGCKKLIERFGKGETHDIFNI